MYCILRTATTVISTVTGWLAATNVKVGNSKRLRLGKQQARITAACDTFERDCVWVRLAAFNQVRLATATGPAPAQPAQRDKKSGPSGACNKVTSCNSAVVKHSAKAFYVSCDRGVQF